MRSLWCDENMTGAQNSDYIMDMNNPIGKKILALVRKADYAHAGEEEAVDIVFKNIPNNPKRLLLDVGCGRGGTAQYIQHKGLGRVTGIDIDSDSIDYAKKAYPEVEFMAADAMNFAQNVSRKFDIIYLFNTFYAFSNHLRALRQLCVMSHDAGQLIIFDYLLKSQNQKNFPFKEWNPLDFSVIPSLFLEAGWRVVKEEDISALYEKWYRELIIRIETSANSIIALAGKEWFDFVRSFYSEITDAIEKKLLGGAIVYALKEP